MPEFDPESIAAPSFPPMVSAGWLAGQIGRPDVVILDASWFLPSAGRDPEAEFRRGHIPGAIRFDLDAASDPTASLPHMAPSAEQFATLCEQLGVSRSDRVVCYDTSGVNLSAARAWWLFRLFGHPQVAVLDGGFGAWASATRPLQVGPGRPMRTGYHGATLDHTLVREMASIADVVAGDRAEQIVDCRSRARFRGEEGEPRAGLARGHIPGSQNLPFTELSVPSSGLLLAPELLARAMENEGIDLSRQVVASCGSGVSACVLALSVEVVRAAGQISVGPPVAIYDGSWAEWGARG